MSDMTFQDTGSNISKLNELTNLLHNSAQLEKDAENELQQLRISNLEKLKRFKIESLETSRKKEEEIIMALEKMGFDSLAKTKAEEEKLHQDRLARYTKEAEAAKEAIKASEGSNRKKEAELKKIDAELEAKIKAENKFYKNKDKLESKFRSAQKKLDEKEREDRLKKAAKEFGRTGEKGRGLSKKEREMLQAQSLVDQGVYENVGQAMANMKKDTRAAVEKELTNKNADAFGKFLQNALDFTKQLDSTITDIANMKSQIDTRLYGSKSNKSGTGSYWEQMSSDITGIAGVSPFVKQSDIVNNLKDMVGRGIAFDVEQRAFLQTISDKIATTFNANDAALTKLIRIQAADTTAARLGMEAALNAFLNNMYETTEYMTDAAASIRGNLYEAAALMSATNATEFEYQVQKWMGSLYSVGMSNEAVSGISAALGKLSAGQIEGITDSSFGNLLVMAANNAGLSIADILQNGLNANGANRLMTALVNYLGNIYKSTSNNKVVSQQFAKVFGVSASDLKAAESLQKSTAAVAGSNLNYSDMLGTLSSMANSIGNRTGMGELLTNVFDNFKYTMAAGVATNPALFAIYKMANALDSVVGGIALPDIKVMGTGVNLQTTVADLMRVAALSGGLLQGVGSMIGAGGNGGLTGAGLLKAAGINTGSLNYVSRGGKTGILETSGTYVSESGGYVGNTEGSDVYNQTMTSANDSAKQQLIEAQDESEETTLNTVDEHVVAIYKLLQDVTSGANSLHTVLDSSIPFTAVTPTTTI